MITPPITTASFYTVLFERPGAQQLMKILAPIHGSDIDQVLVTSTDLHSDMVAIAELSTCVKQIMENTGLTFDSTITFNPLYLPMSTVELEEKLEVNSEGDIKSVAGFTNPFITMSLQVACELHPEVVDAKVCFKQFDLPPFHEILTEAVVS